MNRIFRRTIDKYLELSTPEELEGIVQWIESFEKSADSDEKISFVEGLRLFLKKIEEAYDEFEQVIVDRDNSIKINENELIRLNETMRNEAQQQNQVIEKLYGILQDVDVYNAAKKRATNTLDPFIGAQLLKMVDQVEGLVHSHRKSIDDLQRVFEQSVQIAGSKSLPDLQDSVAKSIDILLERPSYSMIYMGEHSDLPAGQILWTSTEHQKLSFKSIQATHHEILEIRGNNGSLLGFLGVDRLENEQPISESQWRRITTLTPIISATIEIIGFVEKRALQARMAHDLQTAQLVQQTLIPPREVQLENCCIYSVSESASECGGDWWNYYSFPGKDIVILGDVTGHGTASALVTAFSRGFFDAAVRYADVDIQTVCAMLNEKLFSFHTKDKIGMTLVAVSLDYQKQEGSILSAGHLSPYVVTPGDPSSSQYAQSTPFAVSGSILGLHRGSELNFKTATFPLAQGQKVMLFSDGIVEARNADSQEYTLQKFERRLRKLPHTLEGKDLMEQTLDRYREFMGDAKNEDDMTLLTIEIGGRISLTKTA